MKDITIGWAVTGSFCTFSLILQQMQQVKAEGYNILPIFSFNTTNMDTRFFEAKDFRDEVIEITGKTPVDTLQTAEPLGPNNAVDVMLVAPCTGNTLAKLANAITDTPVTMAVKAHLRNNKPVVIAVSTNDGLGLNAHNLSTLLNTKNVYFVPFSQDNAESKPKSIIAHYDKISEAITSAIAGRQIQPLLQ